MSVRELAEGHERAWKSCYSLSSIGRRLWAARNFRPLALTVNLGYRFYAHNLHRFYTCDWPLQIARRAELEGTTIPVVENRRVCG
jgi:hypothetical protein